MTNDDRLCQRLDALEMRAMHQDRMLEELNATITAQWRQIDLLLRTIAGLNERLGEAGTAPAQAEPPPPHY